MARYGRIQTMEIPIDELKSNLRSAQVAVEIAAKKKAEMRRKILSAARRLNISKGGKQMRSAAAVRNEKPTWLVTREYFLSGRHG